MYQSETVVQSFIDNPQALPSWLLLLFAFFAGLISSLSPCVLSMLPINLAYIGISKISSPAKALRQASLFVLGVSVLMAFLGAFSNFAFAVFTEYKAYIYIAVGLFIFLMSLALLEWIRIPLPQIITKVPDSNPFVVGLVFALLSSPCSSPVLFAVLSAASTLSSWIEAVIVMFVFSLGYTMVIFLASIFAGLLKQLDWFKRHNLVVMRISAFILALLALSYLYTGLKLIL